LTFGLVLKTLVLGHENIFQHQILDVAIIKLGSSIGVGEREKLEEKVT